MIRANKVANLAKQIPLARALGKVCDVCAKAKITDGRNLRVSKRKPGILYLVSFDVCGPLLPLRLGFEYFLLLIDNYSRFNWVRLIKTRDDCYAALSTWKKIVERRTETKLKAVRLDNAPELLKQIQKWATSEGVSCQSTEPYHSNQNGVAERHIRTVENDIRAILAEADLPIEFWPEAAQSDVYVRNRIGNGPEINRQLVSPCEAFDKVKPSINHLRVWGCKCYSFLPTKSLPQGSRKDKLTDRSRTCVFIGYVDNTSSQWQLWAPDLKTTIKAHTVKFAEDIKGGTIDLNLDVQTRNKLPERKPRGRPPKAPVVASINAAVPPVVAESEVQPPI